MSLLQEPSAALRQAALAAYAPATARPAGAEIVRVLVPGLGAAHAVVARAVDGAAELLFTERPPAPARTLHRRAARVIALPPAPPEELEATLLALPDARGRLRTDAVLALLGQRRPAEEVLDGEGVDDAPDRRSAVRVPVHRHVSIHHPGQIAGIVARTEDLSALGMAVAGARSLHRGDLVRLRMILDGGRPLDAIGEVRRALATGVHGLELVQMRPQDRLWLERWLAAQAESGHR